MKHYEENGPKAIGIPLYEYQDACDSYIGWCTFCQEFTREHTELDADKYDCPICGGNTVMGAENAIICGEITINA